MGVKEYFKGIFNINGDDDFDRETYEEQAEENEAEPERTQKTTQKRTYSDRRRNQQTEAPSAMRMVLARPEIFPDVTAIADNLKEGKTVVLNLETTDPVQARRIVDFLSGAAYAISFKLRSVSKHNLVIIPDNADFSGDILVDDYTSENYFV